jgi:nucleoside-diphosphate-sugar epimerase
LISGLVKSITVDFDFPINLGNDNEVSLNDLSKLFIDKYGNNAVNFIDSAPDDPKLRRPEITRAKTLLNWEPKINLSDGLQRTFNYFKSILNE